MFSVVFALALSFDQQVTVRVGDKPDTTRDRKILADTMDDARDRRRERKRIPVTPELEASAFRDAHARTLLESVGSPGTELEFAL